MPHISVTAVVIIIIYMYYYSCHIMEILVRTIHHDTEMTTIAIKNKDIFLFADYMILWSSI